MSLNNRWSHFRTSFQFKLFLIFTILTFLISCLLSTLYIFTEIHKTRRQATEQLQLRVKQLADSVRLPLYAENLEMLRYLAKQAAQAPEIHAVTIIAPDGRVMADVHPSNPSNPTEVISQSIKVISNPTLNSVESSISSGLDASAPALGTVRIERGTADLSKTILRVIMISTSVAVAFWLSVSMLCFMVLRQVTRSFNTLLHGINAMQEGDFTSRIEVICDDEAGRATRAVNNLANALQQRSEEIKCLHEERLALERQMFQTQKFESLGVMAGGIAHDFNNLLQSIIGNIELASMKLNPDSDPQKYIANALISGKHAAQLTNLMLTYLGKGLLTKKELNLNKLVIENVDMLRTAATTAVSMKLDLYPELPNVIADEAHIQQIVMNLITNAAESIEQQPGVIKITTGVQDCDTNCLHDSLLDKKPEPGLFVFLEVSDNGCGMNEEVLQRLFEPFYTTKFTGRGLGMSAVMGIIGTHCGALFVQSTPGKGSTFRVLLPITVSVLPVMLPEPAASPPEKSTNQEKSLSGVALVVDDEKSVLKICTKMVQLCGLTVISACDGIDAVAKFRKQADEIDIVLMDLTMPNMDGITAMKEIYLIRPDIKIILSSGFNNRELNERLTGQNPSGFIRKPYRMKVLETELRRVMLADY